LSCVRAPVLSRQETKNDPADPRLFTLSSRARQMYPNTSFYARASGAVPPPLDPLPIPLPTYTPTLPPQQQQQQRADATALASRVGEIDTRCSNGISVLATRFDSMATTIARNSDSCTASRGADLATLRTEIEIAQAGVLDEVVTEMGVIAEENGKKAHAVMARIAALQEESEKKYAMAMVKIESLENTLSEMEARRVESDAMFLRLEAAVAEMHGQVASRRQRLAPQRYSP